MSGRAREAATLPHHRVLDEPRLVFGPGEQPPTHVHPLQGLLVHGPYARPFEGGAVRVATVSATGQAGRLRTFLADLLRPHVPTDRSTYVPPFPGFREVTGLDLVPARGDAHLELPTDTPGEGPDGHERLAAALARAVARLHAVRDQWDVMVFLLPTRWDRWSTSPDGRFELHDRLKAAGAPLGCPSQMLRESSALRYPHVASLAWRLTLALLAKAGGTPWKVTPTTPQDTAYIGLAYAIRGGSSSDFVTCCSQVLDASGSGMEFVAYNVGAARDLENPHLTRDEMRAVMSRSARLYQHRHAGRLPRRVSVHKTTRWRADEVDGVIDAWAAATDVECVTVQRTSWRGVVLEQSADAPSAPASWPADRGTLQQLSGRSALLWVNATGRHTSLRGGRYNPSVKGLPTPMLFTRDAGHGPLEVTGADLLALSTLNWNNDAPYDPMPVTVEFSGRLARTIARVPHLPDDVYQHRLFM